MKSLVAIHNPGVRVHSGLSGLGDVISDLQAKLDAAKADLALWTDRLDSAYRQWPINRYGGQSESQFNAIVGRYSNNIANAQAQIGMISQQITDEQNRQASAALVGETKKQAESAAAAQTPEELVRTAQRFAWLSAVKRGPDYGVRSDERNALFYRDVGLSFDFFGAAIESLKANAPAAFKGVKGGDVVKTLLPNAGGPSIKAPSLPSWLPKISLPSPLRDVARRTGNLASATAKDVLAKKRAADAASRSGVASQTSDFDSGSPASNSSMVPWAIGGAAILAVGAALMRGRR